VFSIHKSVAIEGKKREIIENHSLLISGWDIDCSDGSSKLVSKLAYTVDGVLIADYPVNTFSYDFLGPKALPNQIVDISRFNRLSGDMKDLIISRACNSQ